MNSNRLKQVYIFMGPPGAGKGTLSSLCADRLGWSILSTGNLCRQHLAQKAQRDKEVLGLDFAVKSGILVSDDHIVNLVETWFTAHGKDTSVVILDGFPRTIAQALCFDAFLSQYSPSARVAVLNMVVPDDIIMYRLGARIICDNPECQSIYTVQQTVYRCLKCSGTLVKRVDDQDRATIERRLGMYHSHAQKLLEHYEGSHAHQVCKLDVNRPLEVIFKDFLNLVEVSAA